MPEIHLDLLNLNSVLLILLIILIGGYLYYEIYQLKSIIDDLQYTLNKQQNLYRNNEPAIISESNTYPHDDTEIHGDVYQENTVTRDPIVSDSELIREQMEYGQESNDAPDIRDSPGDTPDTPDTPDDTQGLSDSVNIDDILLGKNIITDNTLSDVLNVDDDLQKIDEFMNTIKAEETKEVVYSSMTVSQLKKILSDEGISVSGNKTKLIERIKENKL
jgi:hypothetical protein